MVILGAGTAGLGIADQIRDAMTREGLSREDASARLWLVDTEGLLTDDMGERLHDYQAPYARPARRGEALEAQRLARAPRTWPKWCVRCGPPC